MAYKLFTFKQLASELVTSS